MFLELISPDNFLLRRLSMKSIQGNLRQLLQTVPTSRGNNSSVNESILTKFIGYRLSMVLIIYTKNASNLTNRY